MSEKPLECTVCSKLKDYGEPHNFYDCVQHLKGVIKAKGATIAALAKACTGLLRFLKSCDMGGDWCQDNYPAVKAARAAIKEANARPTKIGARDPKTGAWRILWTDNVYRARGETCPLCGGPIHAPDSRGDECSACHWGRVALPDRDPGPAPAEMINDPPGNDIDTPYGMCKAPRRDRFKRGLTNF